MSIESQSIPLPEVTADNLDGGQRFFQLQLETVSRDNYSHDLLSQAGFTDEEINQNKAVEWLAESVEKWRHAVTPGYRLLVVPYPDPLFFGKEAGSLAGTNG